MRSFLVFAALISISHFVQSAQFSQAFSSSSVLKPNGEVASKSVYINSQGNQILSSNKKPASFGAPPSLFNFLLPPLGVPYEPVGPQTPPPVFKPVPYQYRTSTTTTQRTTSTPRATPKATTVKKSPVTVRTTLKPSLTKRTTVKPLAIIRSTIKPSPNAKSPITRANISRTSGAYVQDISGSYKFDDRGTYKPDTRGQYDASRFDSGQYRRH